MGRKQVVKYRAYLAVGDGGGYTKIQVSISHFSMTRITSEKKRKVKRTRLLLAEALHTRDGSHVDRMAGGSVSLVVAGYRSKRSSSFDVCSQ